MTSASGSQWSIRSQIGTASDGAALRRDTQHPVRSRAHGHRVRVQRLRETCYAETGARNRANDVHIRYWALVVPLLHLSVWDVAVSHSGYSSCGHLVLSQQQLT